MENSDNELRQRVQVLREAVATLNQALRQPVLPKAIAPVEYVEYADPAQRGEFAEYADPALGSNMRSLRREQRARAEQN